MVQQGRIRHPSKSTCNVRVPPPLSLKPPYANTPQIKRGVIKCNAIMRPISKTMEPFSELQSCERPYLTQCRTNRMATGVRNSSVRSYAQYLLFPCLADRCSGNSWKSMTANFYDVILGNHVVYEHSVTKLAQIELNSEGTANGIEVSDFHPRLGVVPTSYQSLKNSMAFL